MKVEQIYTSCLAEAAYYIHSNGEAAIIDPLRETAPYLERAERDHVKIKYIFLTHFHADFVSGHVDLAKKTGAQIVFGPGAKGDFDFYNGKDNEEFPVGDGIIKLLHTPGHTLESSTYLLIDKNKKDQCIFTGDTLFIGDVGRPDLAVKQGELTEKDLAKHLFHSLRDKIMPLPNDVIVYPNHGAGSACGKNMSKETFDTLGHQKEVNYALRADMTEAEFVKEVLTGLSKPPQYFSKNVMMNKGVNPEFDSIISQGTEALIFDFVSKKQKEGVLILDVRSQADFTKEHIAGSIFIGLNGQFAPWVGALIKDINQPIILICPEGKEEEAVKRLSRIGYDNAIGYLKGGVQTWKDNGGATDFIESISPEEFEAISEKEGGKINVLDVRKPGEYDSEHLINATNEPLDYLNENISNLDKDKTYYVHCAGGYRSVIFESIAKAAGIHHIIDVKEGFGGIKNKTKLDRKEFVCPSTLV
ncbi:MBL fold metallo-hydrolase [Putridiphycobacter roseus]|uniref:MBL fold metallo-hydrolase n=1 Tax=Putridiphycobacter roseus TaxID=2219161 RepID=A0A2W1MWG9_9FLAO|nr:MBL fold metallo-hydrolase [Putridiphycobacter roseus]PZE15734.1 MBL fold metallo-hydrolase [Putridiphycobacter roseus]